MTQTIIVPLSGDDADARVGEAAIPVACALAERTGAAILLVTVVEPQSPASRGELPAAAFQERREWLEEIARQIDGPPVKVAVLIGQPGHEIAALVVDAIEPMIVMTTHARRGLRRVLLGSVAFQVVRDAPCPVVVVPPSIGEIPKTYEIERVLVPLDESPSAEVALEVGLTALAGDPLDVVLLEVVEQLVRRSGLVEREYARLAMPTAQAYLDDVASDVVAHGHRAYVSVRFGYPGREITDTVRNEAIDLVVMATRGRSGLGRVVLGSVAEDVLRAAEVPLLLIGPGVLTKRMTSPEAVSKRGLAARSRAVAETTGGIVG